MEEQTPYVCFECGEKFYVPKEVETAWETGARSAMVCPGCGGYDVDVNERERMIEEVLENVGLLLDSIRCSFLEVVDDNLREDPKTVYWNDEKIVDRVGLLEMYHDHVTDVEIPWQRTWLKEHSE